jgi:hypothetical protein
MMILDTNVVSEAIKAEPHPSVLAWLDLEPPRRQTLPTNPVPILEQDLIGLLFHRSFEASCAARAERVRQPNPLPAGPSSFRF